MGGPPPEVKIEPDPCYELLRYMSHTGVEGSNKTTGFNFFFLISPVFFWCEEERIGIIDPYFGSLIFGTYIRILALSLIIFSIF